MNSTYSLAVLSTAVGTGLLLASLCLGRKRWIRRLGVCLAALCLLLSVTIAPLQYYYERQALPPESSLRWGVTFSSRMSESLHLDWRENYRAILNELHPAAMRLPVYWNQIEPTPNHYFFADLDWQLEQAEQFHTPIILAIGQRAPRWPECYYPSWLDYHNQTFRQERVKQFIQAIVERYKDNPALMYWQVENEPLLVLTIIKCPRLTYRQLQEEAELVRRLDPHHQIITTDSGEVGWWYGAAKVGDIFGTTMYRQVYNNVFRRQEIYPLTPEYYRLKRDIMRHLVKKPQQPYVVIELQAEPWGSKQISDMALNEQLRLFSPVYFHDLLGYARRSGFDTYYLWGVEWWYWLKIHGVPDYWKTFQQLTSLERDKNYLKERMWFISSEKDGL